MKRFLPILFLIVSFISFSQAPPDSPVSNVDTVNSLQTGKDSGHARVEIITDAGKLRQLYEEAEAAEKSEKRRNFVRIAVGIIAVVTIIYLLVKRRKNRI